MEVEDDLTAPEPVWDAETIQEPPEGDGVVEPLLDNMGSVKCRHRAARLAAAHVRSKIGLPKRSEANDLVVARLARDFLVERGVRPTHIQRIAPIALEFVYIPNDDDIFAAQLRQTRAVLEQVEAFEGQWYTKTDGWRIRVREWVLGKRLKAGYQRPLED